jgi:hypothetical protein
VLRSGVGFDLLSWTNIVLVFFAMLALNFYDNLHVSLLTFLGGGVMYGNHTALRNFAFLWLALAVWEHFKRLDEEKRGVEPHTFSPGINRLGLAEFLPWSAKVIAIAVEPALAFLAGAVLRRLGFSMLGWVVIASAISFSVSEWRLSQQLKLHRRDRRNLDKEAQWEADVASETTGRSEATRSPEALRTNTDGLEREINRRKQESGEAAQGGAL